MKELTVPIDQAGRIVVPKIVRDDLAIGPGDTFNLSVKGQSLVLTPNKAKAGFIRQGKALVFHAGDDTILAHDAVDQALAESRDERHDRIQRKTGC